MTLHRGVLLSATRELGSEHPELLVRALYNVRVQPAEGGTTPLTEEEEQRARAVLFSDLGNLIAERGRVRSPRTRRRNAADWST
ncbi:hypothetical protein AB0D38_32690 [Streptomyces sp. NPDC048279]|uniref:hypothetical protein n=1 Tax=Streptomyces sp. NPDC048279 TaxID=3154714 RepID=UPI00341AAB07